MNFAALYISSCPFLDLNGKYLRRNDGSYLLLSVEPEIDSFVLKIEDGRWCIWPLSIMDQAPWCRSSKKKTCAGSWYYREKNGGFRQHMYMCMSTSPPYDPLKSKVCPLTKPILNKAITEPMEVDCGEDIGLRILDTSAVDPVKSHLRKGNPKIQQDLNDDYVHVISSTRPQADNSLEKVGASSLPSSTAADDEPTPAEAEFTDEYDGDAEEDADFKSVASTAEELEGMEDKAGAIASENDPVPPPASVESETEKPLAETPPEHNPANHAERDDSQSPVQNEQPASHGASTELSMSSTTGPGSDLETMKAVEVSLPKVARTRLSGPSTFPPVTLPSNPVATLQILPHVIPSNWKKINTHYWTIPAYYNEVTKECISEIPDAMRFHSNVCSYHITTMTNRQRELFCPSKCLKDLQVAPLKKAYISTVADMELLWASTVQSYDHEMKNMKEYNRKVSALFESERVALREEANVAFLDLERRLDAAQENEKLANNRADGMMTRSGRSYIKREWQQTLDSVFPAGDGFCQEFSKTFANFEPFAFDVENSVEEYWKGTSGADMLVNAMTSIHAVTREYVLKLLRDKQELLRVQWGVEVDFENFKPDEDSVGKLFWLSTQQVQIPAALDQLTDAEIAALIASMDAVVRTVQNMMVHAEGEDAIIDKDEKSLRIPQLVRHMLRFHALALLSDPRCFFEPAPGTRVSYKDGAHTEILSPGVKLYGRISVGEVVEVVLPGLYFDNPEKEGVQPVLPTLVRRLVATK